MTDELLSKASRVSTWVSVALLLIAFFYLSYRYPLQINSSTTSPTYSDTPAILQVGKYMLIAAVAVAAVAWLGVRVIRDHKLPRSARTGDRTDRFVLMAVLLICLVSLGRGVIVGPSDLIILGAEFALVLVLALMYSRAEPSMDVIWHTVSWFAGIAVAVQALQVGLYLAVQRLPALAYADSPSVRFGSLWDDPNGFAVVLALLIPVVAMSWERAWFRIPVIGALFISLILTQSLTGYAGVAVALAATWASFGRWTYRRVAMAASIGVAAILVALVVALSPLTRPLIESKLGSVFDHLDSFAVLADLPFENWLGIGAPREDIESGYVWLIANVGLPVTILYIGVGATAAVFWIRSARRSVGRVRALRAGFFCFTVAFLICSANLQLATSFPSDLLFALAIALGVFTRHGLLEHTNEAYSRPQDAGTARMN